MKNLFLFVLLCLFCVSLPAQELDSLKAIMGKKNSSTKSADGPNDTKTCSPVTVEENKDEMKIKLGEKELLRVVENEDTVYVKVGDKKVMELMDHPDSTRIRVGDKEISIVAKNDRPDIHIGIVDGDDIHGKIKFRGHWAGFEWGINGFLDNEFTLSREDGAGFMDLNTGRSCTVNINFAQYSLGFGSSHVGMVTGLGLEYNNYYFDHANSIAEINDYVTPVTLDDTYLVRSKLTTSFLRVPILFETQFPGTVRSKRIFISAGIIGGIKLGSHTKVVYKDDSGKNKDKNKDDYNINPFRCGMTVHMGFRNMSVFGDYYFTPLYVKGKGPFLHPFSMGVSFTI